MVCSSVGGVSVGGVYGSGVGNGVGGGSGASSLGRDYGALVGDRDWYWVGSSVDLVSASAVYQCSGRIGGDGGRAFGGADNYRGLFVKN